ncbi:MAG: pilus assembly protein PilP [Fibrobacter sp.]|nr:pilus assembly protein PilP [Fibrobacter sp.]
MNRKTLVYIITLLAWVGFQGLAHAVDDKSNDGNEQKLTLDVKSDGYIYNHEGRHDPFKPFVSVKQSATNLLDPDEIVEEEVTYSGMQLFEPGQLNLVGVMMTRNEPIALVEDQTKKGYVLRLGSLIGKRGKVTAIETNQVIITETAKTRAGKEMKSQITMRMKAEGDK